MMRIRRIWLVKVLWYASIISMSAWNILKPVWLVVSMWGHYLENTWLISTLVPLQMVWIPIAWMTIEMNLFKTYSIFLLLIFDYEVTCGKYNTGRKRQQFPLAFKDMCCVPWKSSQFFWWGAERKEWYGVNGENRGICFHLKGVCGFDCSTVGSLCPGEIVRHQTAATGEVMRF